MDEEAYYCPSCGERRDERAFCRFPNHCGFDQPPPPPLDLDDFDYPQVSMVILAGHPYLYHARPSVVRIRADLWSVKWRTFDTIKQDQDCASEAEAQALAATILRPPVTVTADTYEELAEFDRYWRS